MRYISFALTTDQVRAKTKTVTRRIGWVDLQPGTLLQPAVKCQGLKKGETIEKIGGPIRIVSVRREPLNAIEVEPHYGRAEVQREGFEHMSASEFVAMFCATHRIPDNRAWGLLPKRRRQSFPMLPCDEVTRIEFEYA